MNTRFVASLLLTAMALCMAPADAEETVRLEAGGPQQQQWFRGNMHTHSHWSDGNDYQEMIGSWYRDNGYNFLVFTDHNVLSNTERWIDVEESKGGAPAFEKLKEKFPDLVQERTNAEGKTEVRLLQFDEVVKQLEIPGKFLLIQGEEISDKFEGISLHLNVSNIAEVIEPMTGTSVFDTLQSNIRAAEVQRERTGQTMMIHVNHPNFGYAIPAEDLMRLIGEKFFEVYNGHPVVFNSGDADHAGTERIWDIVLTKRLAELHLPIMYGLATDDGHDYHQEGPTQGAAQPGRGWVMVLSDELKAETLVDSLEAGRFYSSSGVNLKQIESSSQGMSVVVDATPGETYTIEFIGTRKGYDRSSQPVLDEEGNEMRATRRYSAEMGETLAVIEGTEASYTFQGDEIYVRARITSSAKHPNPSEEGDFKQAWCQPVVGPGLDTTSE